MIDDLLAIEDAYILSIDSPKRENPLFWEIVNTRNKLLERDYIKLLGNSDGRDYFYLLSSEYLEDITVKFFRNVDVKTTLEIRKACTENIPEALKDEALAFVISSEKFDEDG